MWKDIPNFEKLYQINEYGIVKSLKRTCKSKNGKQRIVPEKILSHKIDKYGYPALHLSKDNKRSHFTIHRLVAITFISNPENYPEVNHKDGIKTNNHYLNLEWCTTKYNIQHSFDNFLNIPKKGSDRAFSKLLEEDVLEIRRLYNEGISCKKLGAIYKISHSTVHDIVTRKSWKHV